MKHKLEKPKSIWILDYHLLSLVARIQVFVLAYTKHPGLPAHEYVLAGSERREVLKGLERWVKRRERVVHRIIKDKHFVYDEDGHWDVGRERAFVEVLEELKKIREGR